MVRLQKFLADAGVASRRAAEKLILDRHIAVNGSVVDQLGTRVDPSLDRVEVDGRPVRPRRKVYIALNKPRGYLCTRRDPEQRQVVHELLPREWAHLFPVGRLDRDTEGLLLLTNDGEFSLRVSHPRHGIRKLYVAEVAGRLTDEQAARLTRGLDDAGEWLQAVAVRLITANPAFSVLELELAEGRNREVRRLLEAVGHPVLRLSRTRIGPLRLGELPPGRWRVLSAAEVKSLLSPRP